MKKFLSLFTVLAILVSMFPTIVGSAAVNTTVFYNAETNGQITTLDGVASVYATTTFTGRYEDNASVIVSHYTEDGKLIKVESIVPVESAIGQEVTCTTLPISVADTGILKVFAWTGVDTIKPLLKFPGIISRVNEILPPTATVSELKVEEITDVELTYAMNFKADPATEAQLLAYGNWYADFELKVNKDVTFNLDGTKDGYLAGQYDSWSPAWVPVPKMDINLPANTPLKIMETGAQTYGKPGLKYTYGEVYDRVKDFDCGVYFTPEFLAANPDLKVTLELRMYNPLNEAEYYSIAGPYSFPKRYVTQNTQVLTSGNVTAEVPAGVLLNEDVTELTLTTAALENSESGLEAGENETLSSMDVHVEGVSPENTTPIIVTLKEATEKGYNKGNLSLFHVENGETVAMEEVETKEDLVKHNQFTYDPADGTVTLALANFSEIAMLADTTQGWNGAYNYEWYDASKTQLTIANADQMAGFGAIVGGMAEGIERDDFNGQTVKLISDLNFEGGHAFYPIGYYNNLKSYTKQADVSVTSNVSSFEGTFDGNGNTIKNIYQNTWDMFGDYNDGYEGTPNHYKDAMGVFGYVKDGTVKNLNVKNFESDGEFTPTGVIAAYAKNSTFENIALTNCNPRVYNTGNGGIVGIGGNSDDPDTDKLTFTNITIDNSNKISALWGSWDVACGGLVGMFRGAGRADMTNCHVAAQIDVYNDVCGNYQYYWYRYSGMMIGTNKNMITDKDGYTVPETSKFHAEGCTVHFGDWNNYWYCELVANSLASYTHDHQFSRLTRVDAVDAENMTVTVNGETTAIPTSGRYNYVVVTTPYSTENATCYHFVDGKVWNHTDAGKETVNGVEVNKEDNAHIYLPFNQLFTGYGWGVKHIPVYNGENYAFDGITILDRAEANSVVKFDAKVEDGAKYTTGKTVTIGELFEAATIEDEKLTIKGDKVQVTVSPVGEDSTASATYVANTTDWTQGTLTFDGAGAATITITDYYFCTPTTITVTVEDRQPVEKFETKFTGDFLYRVGNQNAVSLSSLFKAKDGVPVGNVDVKIETIAGNATGDDVSNVALADGKIQFTQGCTGVVKVTITDNNYCTPTELLLEVVDATNVTSAPSTLTKQNYVLLNDVHTSDYKNFWYGTLYGNGFTYSVTGAPTEYNSKQGHGVIIAKSAVFDNVVFVGDVYDSYGAYTTQDDYNALIDSMDGTVIMNCHISHCSEPVLARGDTTIKNTTLYGGTVANLMIKQGTVVLEDVTTVNYADGRSLVGMGIVVHKDAEPSQLILNGTLKQYNFMSEANKPSDTYAQQLYNAMFDSSCSGYHFGTTGQRYVNTGIISMTAKFNGTHITDNAQTDYVGKSITVNGTNGYVYTQPNSIGNVDNDYHSEADSHKATTYGVVEPNWKFDHAVNHQENIEGSNDACFYSEESKKVVITYDEGGNRVYDPNILVVSKHGNTLNYSVTLDGVDYTNKNITFSGTGDHQLVYTYTDGYNYAMDVNGELYQYEKTYSQVLNISVAGLKGLAKNAEFTMGSGNTSTEKLVGTDGKTYISATGVSANNSTWASMTVGGQTVVYPIVSAKLTSTKGATSYAYFPVFENVVSITDYAENGTGDAIPYNSSTTALPAGLTAVKGKYTEGTASSFASLNDSSLNAIGPTKIFKWASGSDAPADPVVYEKVLCYKSPEISANREAYITLVQYSYTDATETTYYYYVGYTLSAFTYQNCITPDTLITLADGSKVRVDSLTGDEELLVWNLETGSLDSAPIMFLDSESESEFEIVHLYFSDGTDVKVIYEHGFWDYDLNRYVYLDKTADKYIGHTFAKQNGDTLEKVQLVDVVLETEVTTAWSPVTKGHLCYFVNGMLSMPGGVGGLFNIFEVDPETMTYDYEKMAEDIETYGLYTYEEMNAFAPLSEAMFNEAGGAYLKVSIGKGNMTLEELTAMINRYSKFFE